MTAERRSPAAALPLPAMLLGIVVGTLCIPGRAQDSALADGLERLAKEVIRVLAREGGEKAVVVGDFVGAPALRAAGGPGIAQRLSAALEAQGVAVRNRAPYQVHGTFKAADGRAAPGDSFDSVALRIEATVLDGRGQDLEKLNINIFSDESLQFLNPTLTLPPSPGNAPSAEREDAKRQAVNAPRAALAGTEIRSSADSPFGIEVLVGKQARPPHVEDGRAFVDLRKGEEYVVRLHNRAPFEAAVTLTVDGLSMFAFSEEGEVNGQVLVPAGRFVEIPGWYVTKTKTDTFEISGYSGSTAAAKLKPPTGVGAITATFHEAIEGGSRYGGRRLYQPIGPLHKAVTWVVKPPIAVVSVRHDR